MWEERKRPLGVLSYLCTPACVLCPGSDEHDCMCGKWRPMQDCLFLHGWVRVRDSREVRTITYAWYSILNILFKSSHLTPETLFQKANNFELNTLNNTRFFKSKWCFLCFVSHKPTPWFNRWTKLIKWLMDSTQCVLSWPVWIGEACTAIPHTHKTAAGGPC